MLPSSSPSTSTNRLTPTPASIPISTAAGPTDPGCNHHRQPTSTATGAAATTAEALYPAIAVSPPPNDPSLYKRGPSSSLDGQSPDSSSSLPGGRDDVSAIPQDQRTKKRRTGGPGSRGVANLTPEQLAKKRANGRLILPSILVSAPLHHMVIVVGVLLLPL